MFNPQVTEAIKAHALAEWPREAGGLVIDGAYHPMRNVHVDNDDVAADPYDHFQLPDDAWPIDGRTVQATVHSHCAPRHALAPSAADLACQMRTAVPMGLVLADKDQCTDPVWLGDHLLDEPLIGRQFLAGVRDCYSLLRGYFWQERQVMLPEVPRDAQWWEAGGDLYRDGFAAAGFVTIEAAQAEPGDVALIQVRSPVPNHASVLLPQSLMLHHLQGRLSRREPIGPWRKMVTHWLRFQGR